MESFGICIPTYNESRNLPVLIGKIRKHLPQAHLFVVDDNSPDGTGFIAKQMALKDHRLHVISRRAKDGLGAAYRAGFRRMLDNKNIQLIAQMDADLSHPVRFLGPMMEKAKAADLVIGSRYVPGGEIKNWHPARRLLSRFGSLYARLWLGLSVHDLTGGYKIWRRALLERVINEPLAGTGYVFQVEMTYRAHCLGAKISEVPITFVERTAGKSKMSATIALEACWHVPMLRFGKTLH